jgi:hypothetical protein
VERRLLEHPLGLQLALRQVLRFPMLRMHDFAVARLFTFVLLIVAVIAAIYVWQHRASIDNPGIPAPGPKVVTINPLP